MEPSVDVWKFISCRLSVDTFYMIMHVLAITNKTWTELDFIECNHRNSEFEVVCDYLGELTPASKVCKLQFSRSTLPSSITSTLPEIITAWDIKQLIISDGNSTLYSLVDRLRE